MTTARRLAARLRSDIPVVCWVLVAVVFLVEYAWWHHTQKLWDGDALYYVANALKYAGHSTDDAMRLTGQFFHQESTVGRIQGGLTGKAGQPDAVAYDLFTPRMLFPLVSVPFILVLGTKGIWLTTALCGAVFVYLMMRLLGRLFDVQTALVMVLLYLMTRGFWQFQTGLYTETVAAVLIVLILFRLPIWRTVERRDLVWLAVLLVLLNFTRQATLVPACAVIAAWLWSGAQGHGWGRRNDWARPALVSIAVCVVGQAISTVLFPYNQLRHFSEVLHLGNTSYVEHHLGATIGKLPHLVWNMAMTEFHHYLSGDPAMQVLWVLSLTALVIRFRSVYAALFAGSLIACVFLTILDATGNTAMRYFVPMYPMSLMLIADLLRTIARAAALPVRGSGEDSGDSRELVTASRVDLGLGQEHAAGQVGTA